MLRAAELEGDWLDAVVAGEPNIYLPAPGSRTLYDYTTEAALLMPCALLHLPADSLPQPPLRAQIEPLWTARCAVLNSTGLISGDDTAAQAKSAYEHLRAKGWTDQALTPELERMQGESEEAETGADEKKPDDLKVIIRRYI